MLILIFCTQLSCKKNNSGRSLKLSNEEKKLLGHWDLKKQIIEEPGQPTVVNDYTNQSTCFMEFKDIASVQHDQSSPIYSNTKQVQDNKDCSWLLNAWKIDNNGKLLLASLDTIYADILYISTDSLVFKAPSSNDYNILITYQFK